jgi:hypothetical protein
MGCSVVMHNRSSWAFTAQVKEKTKMEDSGAFSVTTSSLFFVGVFLEIDTFPPAVM